MTMLGGNSIQVTVAPPHALSLARPRTVDAPRPL